MRHHSMRAYYLALAGGVLLMASAFLPWLHVGEDAFGGVPDLAGLWVLGLGALAVVLAALSIATRKNSRHPLLVVGLAALGILLVAYRLMLRAATERAWAASQAVAIVDDVEVPAMPAASTGAGVYVGVVASILLVLFGLTIVFRRVGRPYAEAQDDDV